jgi:lipopolysaccharide transport system ATP-binding protein
MGSVAIRTENLSKRYNIGQRVPYKTLREVLVRFGKAPLNYFQSKFKSLVSDAYSGSEDNYIWAVKDLSVGINHGEIVGIIGRNGAGKSTLLKLLARITAPTSGSAEVFGRVGSLLEVGTGFHPELTGRENVFLNGAILGMRRIEILRKFDEIVDFAELAKFIDTPVKFYSSGMYVRLAFSVAAHLETEILFVDEVLAVGDAAFQKKCLGKMGDVAKTGRTVLFVSHNLAVLRAQCHKVYWLDEGLLADAGSPGVIIDAYLMKQANDCPKTLDLLMPRRPPDFKTAFLLTKLEWLCDLPLVHGGPMELCLHYSASKDVEDVSIGIGFSTLEGVRVLTYETDLYGPRTRVSKGESSSVHLRLSSFPLGPGFYSIDLGARSGDLYGLDYLPGIAQIEVVPGEMTSGNMVLKSAGVRLASSWTWERSDC